MKTIFFTTILLLTLLILPSTSAAHWIVGYVEDALDGTSPNSRSVRLWNPSNSNETFGIVGTSGQSETSNVFMIDCEMLAIPCVVGDSLNLILVDDGTGHISKKIINITVTGAGFDVTENITMNSPPSISSLTVEDLYTLPANEIDLTPNATTQISCTGIITDYDGIDSLSTVLSYLYTSSINPTDPDDNNDHYTNTSCEINTSYGTPNEASLNCSFEIEYYASSETWQCQINATDNVSTSTTQSDSTFVNALLSIGVNSTINFGEINTEELTQEETIEITNYGNVKINLSMSGFGETENDGNAMICSSKNISIEHMKYNTTSSTIGNMNLSDSELYYTNLTSSPVVEEFGLNSRQDDTSNDAVNETYWRVYVPTEVASSCQGNIILGATQV